MYLTHGIVLAKKEIGEADMLYTIYTKNFGKMRAHAQGIRKEGAKLRGHIEVLSVSSLGFVIGKRSPRLVYAKLLSFWEALRANPIALRAALVLSRWVDTHSFPGLPDEPIYTFLLQQMEILEKGTLTQGTIKSFLDAQKRELTDLLGGETSVGSFSSAFVENF